MAFKIDLFLMKGPLRCASGGERYACEMYLCTYQYGAIVTLVDTTTASLYCNTQDGQGDKNPHFPLMMKLARQ